MKFKYLFIFISVLFLSGCKATYYVDLDEGYAENMTVNLERVPYNDSIKFVSNNTSLYVGVDENIDGSLPDNAERYIFNYNQSNNTLSTSHKFLTYDNFMKSNMFNSCFGYKSFTSSFITLLETSNTFTCFDLYPDLDEVTIQFHTSKNVLEHNADNISDNTYTWTFTRDNYRLKSIYLKYSDEKFKNTQNKPTISKVNNEKKESKKSIFVYIAIPLSFVLIFAIMFLDKKYKR